MDKFYGRGIFLTPSKRVAWKYANANRNIGFPVSIIQDLKRIDAFAGSFLKALVDHGDTAWEMEVSPGLSYGQMFADDAGDIDLNTVHDIAGYVIGSKVTPLEGGGSLSLFSTSTGTPDWVYDSLDEVGLDSKKYRPKVYTVAVKVNNVLVTARKDQAKKARAQGYDCVVFHGSGLVDGVPEVAVFDPRKAKVVGVRTSSYHGVKTASAILWPSWDEVHKDLEMFNTLYAKALKLKGAKVRFDESRVGKKARKDPSSIRPAQKIYAALKKMVDSGRGMLYIPREQRVVVKAKGLGLPNSPLTDRLYFDFNGQGKGIFYNALRQQIQVPAWGLKDPKLLSWKEVVKDRVRKNKKEIIHELVHHMDYHRMKGGWEEAEKSYSSPDKDWAEYYNHPLELNAYYQQGVEPLISEHRKLLRDLESGTGPGNEGSSAHQLAVMALGDLAQASFEDLLKDWKFNVPVGLWDYLTQGNRRRMRKRLYDIYRKTVLDARERVRELQRRGDPMAEMLDPIRAASLNRRTADYYTDTLQLYAALKRKASGPIIRDLTKTKRYTSPNHDPGAVREVEAVLRRIPGRFVEGVREINLFPPEKASFYVDRGSDGEYQPNTRLVFVSARPSLGTVGGITAHELGHHVADHILTAEQRGELQEKVGYRSEDWSEDFASCFGFYFEGKPSIASRYPHSYRLLMDLLGKKRQRMWP